MLLAATLLALLQAPLATPSDSIPDTFLDRDAAAMVAGARARTQLANDRIAAYQAVAKQRLSLSIRGLRRDRLIYSRELASQIDWRRDGPRTVEVLGARQASEVAGPGEEPFLGDDLISAAAGMAFDPTTEWLLQIPGDGVSEEGDAEGDATAFVHPLASGSEAHYRFRSGETTSIRLGSGEVVRLKELQVLPRRSRSNLVTGSLWLEEATDAAVRGVFTLASPVTLSVDVGPGNVGIGTLGGAEIASATLGYLTIEYGLWEGEWWLPRLMALEGAARVGRFEMPMIVEQRFEDFRIFADAEPLPLPIPRDTTLFEVTQRACEDEEECPGRYVLVPRDTSMLIRSELLPGSIFDEGRLVTEAELEQMVELVSRANWQSMFFRKPQVEWNMLDTGLVHYNRVEGLALGTSATVDLQPLSLKASASLGLADGAPKARLDVSRARFNGRESLSLYRRVAAFTPEDNPFSLGSSISALALGNDDGDYYRATGVALTAEQTPSAASTLRMRVYAERQSPLQKKTDGSLQGLVGEHTFRDNPAADAADQLGLDIRARVAYGATASRLRGGVEGRMQAERGTFIFARPSANVYLTLPVLGSAIAGIDVGAGTSFGDLPLQSLWYLGGASTVRGFRAEDRISGEAFWRGRAEVGNDVSAARMVLFTDAGWAGGSGAFTTEPTLVSGGVGLSLLDGLIRADLTRTLRGDPGRWGFQLQLDAIF